MKSKKKCTGCGACAVSCPKKCIKIVENIFSEHVPKINTKECINCGICKKVCPENHPIYMTKPKKCYVAWSLDKNDRNSSSSGGAATVFYRHIIQHGGVAFGCDYDSDAELYHFKISSLNELRKTQSSKYSRSSAYMVFEEIKNLLDQSIKVLFVGTPCQVAGLLKYLKKDYPCLITVDLICHGTPPNKYLQEHLKSLKIKFPISKIRFRGEYDHSLTVWGNDGIIYQNDRWDDLYYSAFYKNMISYSSCYTCQYAQAQRVSDITIGDFWGLGQLNNITPLNKKPSIILLNSNKGEDFFNDVKNLFLYEERTVDEGISGNGRLMNPPGNSFLAKLFRILYIPFGFKTAVRLSNFYDRHILNYINNFIKKFSRRF